MKINVLFLCTGNSCRSQMAEGWGKALKGDKFNFYSAGIEKHGLNPLAVQVMNEAGVDISQHTSKTIHELKEIFIDTIVTVCDHARESCPVIPGSIHVIHQAFEDPPYLARNEDSDAGKLAHYRKVRDEIREFIESIEIQLEPTRLQVS